MSAYSNSIKEYFERFRTEVGIGDGLIDPHEVAEWAYRNGCHKRNVNTVIDQIAADISQSFRAHIRTYPSSRPYTAEAN